MSDAVKKLRLFVLVGALAVAGTIGYSVLTSGAAVAQSVRDLRAPVLSAGPIQMASGERALIGLLLPAVQLPAVQRRAVPYRILLLKSDGSTLAQIAVPFAPAGATRQTALYEVAFGDGSVRVTNRATGEAVFTGDLADGTIIVVCLPAVQSNGLVVPATGGTVQLFDPAGARGQIVGFCDGSV